MSWEDTMRRVLPPIMGVPPRVTKAGAFGAGLEQGRKPPSTIPHRGVDFNYIGGQSGINLTHPEVRSPVAGTVTNAGQGTAGRIAIRDANGFTHEILHTHTRDVKVGDRVDVGQSIGTMGNTGTKDQHVHYQLKDAGGNVINPADYWNRVTPDNTDSGEPSNSGQYPQYPRGVDAASTPRTPPSDRESWLNGRFAKWGSAPANVAPPPASASPESFDDRYGNWGYRPAAQPQATVGDQPVRYLGRRIAGEPTVFDTGAPPLPFAPSLAPLSPNDAPYDPAGADQDRLWFLQGWR